MSDDAAATPPAASVPAGTPTEIVAAGEIADGKMHQLLPRFGLREFRRGQDQVIAAVDDGRDVMCVMPTGGGKSLCYQLPALARDGVTIVVSPLIALMKDQVDSLERLGIDAAVINSTMTPSQQSDVMREMTHGRYRMIYVAPERLRNSRFLDALRDAKVSLLAIDEAHCVSEWGHDFRPDYARLGQFRERYLRNVQTIALTATATPMVRQDVIASLRLRDPAIFVTGFARDNLHFSVETSKTDHEKNEQLSQYLQTHAEDAGIIYAATRKRCDEIADWLPEKIGRPVAVYHGGLDSPSRKLVQEAFMSGDCPIIIATNAFGMGIDKSDIRFVIHYNMPGTIEAYYQEAGRAGRDGLDSDCRLLFSYHDRYVQEFFIENRYPSPETVKTVWDFLRGRDEEPIELTLDQVRDATKIKDASEAIGTAQTLLAKAGVLRRLDAASNQFMIRVDSDIRPLVDLLPREARIRRQTLAAVEKVVGRRRHEDVFVRPQRLLELSGLQRAQLTSSLRELRQLRCFDYVPPFRGRAVHVTDRSRTFDDLQIDFEELATRKAAEFEKLESVIAFARSSGCRQAVILDYFGESDGQACGACDRCDDQVRPEDAPDGIAPESVPDGVDAALLLRGIQIVLSGVTRTHGRFGRNLVAQMLAGSKNKKLQGLRLHRLSTYGLLGSMKQGEIVEVMDQLSSAGLLTSVEVDKQRPTVAISPTGRAVMHRQQPCPGGLSLKFPLAKKLAVAASRIEMPDVQTTSAGSDPESPPESASPSGSTGPSGSTRANGDNTAPSGVEPSSDPNMVDQNLTDQTASIDQERAKAFSGKLKRWRQKTAAAQDMTPHQVLSNAVIERLVTELPTTSEGLESIRGLRGQSMEQFGYDILEMIRMFTSETVSEASKPEDSTEPNPTGQSNATSHSNPVAAKQSNDSSTSQWTHQLFRDGYKADQIASIRNLTPEQLIAELADAQRRGLDVPAHWLDDPALGTGTHQRFNGYLNAK